MAAAILAVWFGASGAASAAPALWRVKDADSEIYLFGTLHALSPAVRWRTPLYDQAYARADVIWFETELDRADPARIQDLLSRYGADPDRPLSAKLAPSQLAALSRRVELSKIDHLRPWAAALMLSMQPALERGARVESGADLVLTRAARLSHKRVRVFESLEDQVRIFADLPEPAELRYLSDVLGARRRLRVRLPWEPTLEEAWLDGRLDRLDLIGELKADNPALYQSLLKRRNEAWAEALAGALAGSGVELVNVGALHLLGQDGLPMLLAARGFSVERIQ